MAIQHAPPPAAAAAAPPHLNILQRHVWYADRLREAGHPVNPALETDKLAAQYRAAYKITPRLVPDDPEDDSWVPIRLTELPATPPIEPTLGGVGLVYPGKRHVFSGPPESAKTLAAYAVLINVVRDDGTGILIDFEMGAYDARSRLQELGATPTEIDRIHYLEPNQPADTARVTALVALNAQLVVFDSALGAYNLQGLDDNNRTDVEKLNTLFITPFWRAGSATILIDHVVKDADTRGRYAIGSERKLGGSDVSLGFETLVAVSRGTSGRYKIVTNKDRGAYLKRGHVADLVIVSAPETHQLAVTFAPPDTPEQPDGIFKFDVKMEQISRKLQTMPEPISGNDLYTILGGSRPAHFSAIEDLISGGYVRRIGGPKSPMEFVNAFRRDQVVPGGTKVVPVPADDDPVPGTSPSRGGTSTGITQGNAQPFGWFQDDGTFTPSELSYLESIAPDEES